MVDVEKQQELPLPAKRKPDLYCQDRVDVINKARRLQPSSSVGYDERGNCGSELENLYSSGEEKIEAESFISPEKGVGSETERDDNGGGAGPGGEEEEEEDSRREAEVDRKGKGVMRDDKGKGKLVDDDNSDDEDDDDEEESSDLSDDPLAEVDLGNILPSRTRRRTTMQPGFYISDEIDDHEDDDDSDA